MGRDDNENMAKIILATALQAPINQILDNANKEKPEIINVIYDRTYNYGYDVKNDKYGDMYKLGVIDPLKVTKNALLNAVSVATTILSTNAIITHKRQNQPDEEKKAEL